MWQGLDGAPRRWARLPDTYMNLTRLSLVFLAILVIAQVIFLVNLYTTLRRSPFDEPSVRRGSGVKK